MDLAAQDRWSQGQANLCLGILAESADPQAASSYFREVVVHRQADPITTPRPISTVIET